MSILIVILVYQSGLPLTRVKTIMQTSDGVEQVNREAIVLVAQAAKLLVSTLTLEGYMVSNMAKKLQYEHLVEVIHKNERFEFLESIIPRKIKVKDFLAKLAAKKKAEEEEDDEDEESTSGSDSDASS